MIVLLHGVPETAELWNKVRACIDQESVALQLPGFGCPRPSDFGATKDEYVEWLLGELTSFDEPVDLVGHDWGAAITIRVAMTRPEILRSWIADGATGQHPDYVWHDFAKIWQTPGEGERFFEEQLAAPLEAIASIYESVGVPPDDAVKLAAMADATMASCVLDLYRSATPNNYATWGADLGPSAVAGLVLFAERDAFGDLTMSRDVAELLKVQFQVLEGVGHWWALEDPAMGARAIEAFVASI
jgi:pimeloyl-ACP methyl ester carboxylesterase